MNEDANQALRVRRVKVSAFRELFDGGEVAFEAQTYGPGLGRVESSEISADSTPDVQEESMDEEIRTSDSTASSGLKSGRLQDVFGAKLDEDSRSERVSRDDSSMSNESPHRPASDPRGEETTIEEHSPAEMGGESTEANPSEPSATSENDQWVSDLKNAFQGRPDSSPPTAPEREVGASTNEEERRTATERPSALQSSEATEAEDEDADPDREPERPLEQAAEISPFGGRGESADESGDLDIVGQEEEQTLEDFAASMGSETDEDEPLLTAPESSAESSSQPQREAYSPESETSGADKSSSPAPPEVEPMSDASPEDEGASIDEVSSSEASESDLSDDTIQGTSEEEPGEVDDLDESLDTSSTRDELRRSVESEIDGEVLDTSGHELREPDELASSTFEATSEHSLGTGSAIRHGIGDEWVPSDDDESDGSSASSPDELETSSSDAEDADASTERREDEAAPSSSHTDESDRPEESQLASEARSDSDSNKTTDSELADAPELETEVDSTAEHRDETQDRTPLGTNEADALAPDEASRSEGSTNGKTDGSTPTPSAEEAPEASLDEDRDASEQDEAFDSGPPEERATLSDSDVASEWNSQQTPSGGELDAAPESSSSLEARDEDSGDEVDEVNSEEARAKYRESVASDALESGDLDLTAPEAQSSDTPEVASPEHMSSPESSRPSSEVDGSEGVDEVDRHEEDTTESSSNPESNLSEELEATDETLSESERRAESADEAQSAPDRDREVERNVGLTESSSEHAYDSSLASDLTDDSSDTEIDTSEDGERAVDSDEEELDASSEQHGRDELEATPPSNGLDETIDGQQLDVGSEHERTPESDRSSGETSDDITEGDGDISPEVGSDDRSSFGTIGDDSPGGIQSGETRVGSYPGESPSDDDESATAGIDDILESESLSLSPSDDTSSDAEEKPRNGRPELAELDDTSERDVQGSVGPERDEGAISSDAPSDEEDIRLPPPGDVFASDEEAPDFAPSSTHEAEPRESDSRDQEPPSDRDGRQEASPIASDDFQTPQAGATSEAPPLSERSDAEETSSSRERLEADPNLDNIADEEEWDRDLDVNRDETNPGTFSRAETADRQSPLSSLPEDEETSSSSSSESGVSEADVDSHESDGSADAPEDGDDESSNMLGEEIETNALSEISEKMGIEPDNDQTVEVLSEMVRDVYQSDTSHRSRASQDMASGGERSRRASTDSRRNQSNSRASTASETSAQSEIPGAQMINPVSDRDEAEPSKEIDSDDNVASGAPRDALERGLGSSNRVSSSLASGFLDLSDDSKLKARLQSLYRKWLKTLGETGREPPMERDEFMRRVQHQLEQVKEKYGVEQIEMRVETTDNDMPKVVVTPSS